MRLIPSLLICLMLTTGIAPASTRHALLIGIGAYGGGKQLAGPPNDVASISKLLLANYAYNPRFVHTLTDRQATKQAILLALKNLVNEVQPGDYVLFYYSGHGTSFYASSGALGNTMPEDSGASLPVDFDMSSPDAFRKTVLLGRELRPYFAALDEKAQVFAIYDSCYSQDAMKTVARSPGSPKFVPLTPALQGATKALLTNDSVADNQPDTDLPYRHLIALSAARRDQLAIDLPAESTFDHQAHGQLTNAILLGLQGAADKNHDGVITHEELYNYINELSAGKWRHNPKLRISPASSSILDEAAFAAKPTVATKQIELDTACRSEPPRQPRVSVPADLFDELGRGFIPVSDAWDLKAVAQDGGFLLYDTGGIQLNDAPLTRQKTLDRLRAEPILERISELRYCQQSFNTELFIDPPELGKYAKGLTIRFSAKVDQDAYLLVIDIDQEGGITVVYASKAEEQKLKAGTKTFLTETNVTTPYGVDLIKAFAFASKPPGFDRFIPPPGKEIHLLPGDPAFNVLLAMLNPDEETRSETRAQLTTSPE